MIKRTLGRTAEGIKKFVGTASKNRQVALKGYKQSKDAFNLAAQNLQKYQKTTIPSFFEKQVANYKATKQAKRQQFGNILRSSIGMKPKVPTVKAEVINTVNKGKATTQQLKITKTPTPVTSTPKEPKVNIPKEQNTTGVKTTTSKTESVGTTETGAPKKYNWKHLAGAGAAGYVLPKLFGSSQPEYPKYATVGKAIGRLLRSIGNVVPSKGAEAVGKTIVATGTAGLGSGIVAGYLLGDDGHSAKSHGHKKTAEEMTSKEKADQKYAIAKSYEREGHEGKSKEYKDKFFANGQWHKKTPQQKYH